MLALYLSILKNNDDKILFNRLYYDYQAKILSIALDILQKQELAEDATHEVFIKIINNFEQFKSMSTNKRDGWVMIVTQNISLNILKKEKQATPWDDEFLFNKMEQKNWQTQPLDLSDYINSLPANYIHILQLYYFDGYKAKEIAEMLGLTTNTVEQRLSRARKMLKKMILADQKESF